MERGGAERDGGRMRKSTSTLFSACGVSKGSGEKSSMWHCWLGYSLVHLRQEEI